MLLLVVALLQGLNQANATILYNNPSGSGSYVTINFPFGTFNDAKIGDKLVVTYDILPQQGWTPAYNLVLGNFETATVSASGTYEFVIDDNFFQKINTTDANNIATYLTPQWTTIYRVELVSGGDPSTPRYTLTYSADGQTVKTEQLEEGANPTPPAAPAKQGYTFIEWSNLPEAMPARDVTVTAEYAITKYKLFFSLDGELVDSVEYAPGETVAARENPVKTGYTFGGWYGYPENMVMQAWNVTVSGSFSVNHHSIVYNTDGNYYDGKYNIPYGATLSPDYVPSVNPTKVGFIFDHWDGLPETMPDEDLTIEAVFVVDADYHNYKKINYYIDYNLAKSVDWEVGTTIVPADTVKAGHIFSGWTGFPENMVMPDEDINVYGSFTAIYNLTLSFDATKGTVTASKLSGITQNEQIAVTVTPAEGYEVASVTFTDANGNAVNSWGSYTVQFGTADVTCQVTFAQEAAKVYNVWNGSVIGGNVTASPNVAEAGTTVTLTLAPYANYVLESLTVRDQENNSIEVTDNQFTMPAGNVWINAKFVDPADLVAKHTLAFIVDGETTSMAVAEGTALSTLLPTPSKEGYNFTGWSGMPADGNMPTSDLELTAVFVAKVYTSVSVGATGYSTYCSDKALYFKGNEGVKAYIAKSKSDTEVTLIQVSGAVAAGTGLLLVGEPNTTADVEEVAAGESYSNLLVGVLNSSETVNAANKYVLVDKDGAVKFADTANNPATVAPGKAYLQVAAAARQLRIRFEDGTTAILAVKAAGEDADIYDLRGQRVNTLGKGLYIVNGKKVFVK